MVKHKTLKSRKLRGNVSHGHGRVGKHRKHSGGAGKAGGLKHLKTLFSKYHPDYFGKTGMNIFHRKKNATTFKTIPLNRIWNLVTLKEDKFENFTDKLELVKSDKVPVIDCRKFGIKKVLDGVLSCDKPIVVIAQQFTPFAVEEILRVGGKSIVAA
ncbi:60S ribosomal protein L27a [Cucumispora dikerogammari]|nr:60S ribosomal protein L27a [Cucumispora dikerogammari]